MNPAMKAHSRRKAEVVKAMAHSTRRFLVEDLAKGERWVCELTAMVGDDISTVSKHLSVRRNAGIVADDQRGSQVFRKRAIPLPLSFRARPPMVAADRAGASWSKE